MRVRVVSVCYNEADLLPFYLRHYSTFADEIIIFDDDSTDGSRRIAAKCQKVKVVNWNECYLSGLNDDNMMDLWQRCIQGAKFNDVDWLLLPDIDEFIWSDRPFREVLTEADAKGYDVIASNGWNMTGLGLPRDDGERQIYELCTTGTCAPVYSKPIVLKPSATVQWVRGRHDIENCSPNISPPMLKLLHYRYLGYSYTKARNARNYNRVGHDKGAAWSCSESYKGEGSPEWAESIKDSAINPLLQPFWSPYNR